MANFMEIIKGRRGIRSYQDKPISEEDLNTLLESIRWSPSWANTQCWEVIVARDSSAKQKIQDALTPRNPATAAVAEAPVVMVMCAKLKKSGHKKGEAATKFEDWFMFDLGMATQNLCLAAHYLNMATVVVGLLDHDKAKSALNVPDGYEVVAVVPVGYPAQEAKAPPRREIDDFVHFDKF